MFTYLSLPNSIEALNETATTTAAATTTLNKTVANDGRQFLMTRINQFPSSIQSLSTKRSASLLFNLHQHHLRHVKPNKESSSTTSSKNNPSDQATAVATAAIHPIHSTIKQREHVSEMEIDSGLCSANEEGSRRRSNDSDMSALSNNNNNNNNSNSSNKTNSNSNSLNTPNR